jgi:hypothetical protein
VKHWRTEQQSHLYAVHRESVSIITEEWFVLRKCTFHITWYQLYVLVTHSVTNTEGIKFFRINWVSPFNTHERDREIECVEECFKKLCSSWRFRKEFIPINHLHLDRAHDTQTYSFPHNTTIPLFFSFLNTEYVASKLSRLECLSDYIWEGFLSSASFNTKSTDTTALYRFLKSSNPEGTEGGYVQESPIKIPCLVHLLNRRR